MVTVKQDLLLVLSLSALITILFGLVQFSPAAYYSASQSTANDLQSQNLEAAQSQSTVAALQPQSTQLQIANFAPESKKVTNTSGSKPNVFLTYDDGSSNLTVKLLNTLDKYPNVKVTFFVNCKEKVSGTFQRILESGHAIGNHTCNHSRLTDLSSSQIKSQLKQLDSFVNARVSPNVKISAYRPPYGATNSQIRNLADSLGYREWTWNVDTNDWTDPGVSAIVNSLKSAKNGDIVLMHDTDQDTQTLQATQQFLANHHSKYKFSTLPGAATYDDSWDGRFKDDDGSIFEADIEWIANRGITKGCNPPANTKYCPGDFVTREQMASFLQRGLNLPASSSNPFVDINGSVHKKPIQALAASGITKGCNPPQNNRFCPNDTVTRGQLAAFLVRGFGLKQTSGDRFNDDSSSIFENDINKLATAGITKGCNPPTNNKFCPNDNVTREQMAAFLRRALTKYDN